LVSPTTSRLFLDLSMDGRVLGFTAGLGVLTGLLFGLWPAWRATRVSLTSAMKGSEERPRESRSQFRSGRWIVAAQVALSLVLLVGTGLFVRSFLNLLTLDPGFDRRNVLMVRVNVHNAGIPPGARIPLYVQILDRLKSLPGVVSVGQVWFTPISGMEWNNNIQVEGSLPSPGKEPLVWFDGITPGYFATLRTPLLAGRDFDNRDTATSPRVAIVNETLAQRFFPNANAVGKYFRTPGSDGASSPPTQIVGIVKDSKYLSLREEILPFAYVPLPQADFIAEDSTFLIRTAASPAALIPTAREAIAGVNKAASLRFATLAQQVDDSLVPERLLATLSAFFGGLALLLTAIGLYGVMAYLVTRRTHEIGLRMALGARQGSILRLVLRDSAVLLGAGIAAGTAGALWVTQFVRYLLFGLAPRDAGTLAVAVAVLLAVGLVASYLPARRATKVDPMVALRYE
jgi:predicted permease